MRWQEQQTTASTSVERSDETPIPGPYLRALLRPPRAPLDTIATGLAVLLGPEAKIKRGDEEDPVESGFCKGIRGIVWFWR